jgi:hypothetical protein
VDTSITNSTPTSHNNLISTNKDALIDLYEKNPILLLGEDLKQPRIDELKESKKRLEESYKTSSETLNEKEINLKLKSIIVNSLRHPETRVVKDRSRKSRNEFTSVATSEIPNSQIKNPGSSNLKRSQQQDSSSENPNESNNKKPRIR